MLTKPDDAPIPATVSPPSCGKCGLEERRLLHHVRHRGIFRRLCTTCVLRLHAQSFCPTCFQVYPPTPSNDAVMNCFKCYSSSHSRCVAAGPTSLPSPYICPLCTNPSNPIFKLSTAKEGNAQVNDGSEECRVIDRDAAKKLLAAAKIASTSMNKAVVAAKAEAERRAKEAALARKRAKEALEHAAYLVMKEKSRKKEAALPTSASIALSGNSFSVAIAKRESNMNVSSNNRNGNLGNAVDSLVVLEKKTENMIGDVSELENSTLILAESNRVELKDNEKLDGIARQYAELEACLNDGMEVDETIRTTELDEKDIGELLLDGIDIIGEEIDTVDDNMQVEKQLEENNGVLLVPSEEGQVESNDLRDAVEQQGNVVPL